jgi:hypothetical protein
VVVDLSGLPPGQRQAYVRQLLLDLAAMRRRTGYPHRIVVDEAHCFLHEQDVAGLLDLASGGYTLVTYRASDLAPAVLASLEAVVVSRESDPAEVQELRRRLRGAAGGEEWGALRDLRIDEAVLLPGSEESGGDLVRFRVTPRLTPHVRHRHKYLDVPLRPGSGFVFTRRGRPTLGTARTLRELLALLARATVADLDEHLGRGDFSRWIADVLGDQVLAAKFAAVEGQYRRGGLEDPAAALTAAVADRYGEAPRTDGSLAGDGAVAARGEPNRTRS